MQHQENERFIDELYNRCIPLAYGKYEKAVHYNTLMELSERNLLVSVNHRLKKSINIDKIVIAQRSILKKLGEFTVTYIASIGNNMTEKELKHLNKYLVGNDLTYGDVLIGVHNPFEYMAYLYLVGFLFTSATSKFPLFLNKYFHLYRVVSHRTNKLTAPARTNTTSLYIDFTKKHSKLTLKIFNDNSDLLKIAVLKNVRSLIHPYFGTESAFNKLFDYDFISRV